MLQPDSRSRPATKRSARLAESGIATVWAVAWMLVCLCVGWVALLAAMITARQHHLDGAADLVSLSAAARLQRGGDACDLASKIAAANAVELSSCEVESRNDVIVSVRTSMALPFGVDGDLTATSRAGP